MRRKDREITDINKIEEIIASAKYMHLGMFDGTYPYVVPMNYGYHLENGKLVFYVHSAKEGHKLECLKENPHVFVQIDRGESLIKAKVPCGYGTEYESVMCRGTATIIEDTKEKAEALMNLMKVQTGQFHEINEKMAESVNVIRIDVESYTAKACTR